MRFFRFYEAAGVRVAERLHRAGTTYNRLTDRKRINPKGVPGSDRPL